MGRGQWFLTVEKLYSLCKDKKIIEEIKKTSSAPEARKVIEKVLPDGQKITDDIIRKLKKLIDRSGSEEKSGYPSNGEVSEVRLTEDDRSKTDLNLIKQHENIPVDNGNAENNENSIQKRTNGKALEDEKNKIEPHETILVTSQAEKDAVFISTAQAQNNEKLESKIVDLVKENQTLKDQIDELKSELTKYKEKDEEISYEKHFVSNEIVLNINRFLDGNNEKVTIEVYKAILDEAAEILDKAISVNFQNVFKHGNDTYAYINQTALLDYIYKNSFR